MVKSRKAAIKEILIEEELCSRVHASGGVCEKVTVLGRVGFFDRLVLLPGGKIYFVECKRPKAGRLSTHQRERHKIYQKLGAAVAIVLDSEDIDRLINNKK